MSLYKQLWIALAIVMLLAFSGSFLVSSLTTKSSIEDQLHIKNIDNANSLALAATQVAKDPTMVELLVSAQFDTGHYQFVRYFSPAGDLLLERKRDGVGGIAPGWFKAWVDIHSADGVAEIQAGWQQLGRVHLQSDPSFAYDALWRNTVRLSVYFALALLACGAIGHLLLTRLTRPLHQVVRQARAISKRHFSKVPLPRTLEFRELVESMNDLSETIKAFFQQEAERLHGIQQESQIDPVSGTLGREQFMKVLSLAISSDTGDDGSLCVLRVHDLQALNRSQGRELVDRMLGHIGDVLNAMNQGRWQAGRLNGSDFAIIVHGTAEPADDARSIQQAVAAKLAELDLGEHAKLPTAVYQFSAGEALSEVLTRVDGALAAAESQPDSAVETANRARIARRTSLDEWNSRLDRALNGLQASFHPTVSRDQRTVHLSAEACFRSPDDELNSRALQTWAARLDRSIELDSKLLDLVLAEQHTSRAVLALPLSAQGLQSPELLKTLRQRLVQLPRGAVCLEIPEFCVFQSLDAFKQLCGSMNALGCEIGLVNAGLQARNFGQLFDCGLSFIKVDESLVHNIDESPGNQTFVRSIATMFHSIGTRVYAEGIGNSADWNCLMRLGIDGGSGIYADTIHEKD